MAGGGKKGKNNLGVIASPLPHSIFSICTPVKGHPGPLLKHIFLSCFKLEFSDVSDMKDELPPLRPSLFSHVPPFFNYIPNGRDGRFEEVGCGWCKVVQMKKMQFDQQMYC